MMCNNFSFVTMETVFSLFQISVSRITKMSLATNTLNQTSVSDGRKDDDLHRRKLECVVISDTKLFLIQIMVIWVITCIPGNVVVGVMFSKYRGVITTSPNQTDGLNITKKLNDEALNTTNKVEYEVSMAS